MTGLTEAQQELVVEHMNVVGYHVSETLSRVPAHVTRDELASAGYLALTQAAASYDPASGVPFPRYAAIRVRGAMIDELRGMDWVSRGIRRKIREHARTVEVITADLGREPTREEVAQALGVDVSEVTEIRDHATTRVLSYDAYDGAMTMEIPANLPGPEHSLLVNERLDYLRGAIESLPENLRYVIEQVFFHERMSTEIAKDLGVTQSRVSQLRAEAITLLRDGLNTHLNPGLAPPAGSGVVQRRRTAYFEKIGEQVRKNAQAARHAERAQAARAFESARALASDEDLDPGMCAIS